MASASWEMESNQTSRLGAEPVASAFARGAAAGAAHLVADEEATAVKTLDGVVLAVRAHVTVIRRVWSAGAAGGDRI